MSKLNTKLNIINYFDSLINRVDIDIEECIEKYNKEQVLGDLGCFRVINRNYNYRPEIELELYESSESTKNQNQRDNVWSKSTKVIDYLNQVRMSTISELRKAQEDNLEYLKNNSSVPEKYYFQVLYQHKTWIFHLYTFVTDFYLDEYYIQLLDDVINKQSYTQRYCNFDRKTYLILLIHKFFSEMLMKETFPSHLIYVYQKDLSKVKKISFMRNMSRINLNETDIDLSKLEHLSINNKGVLFEINLDGLVSLKSLQLHLGTLEIEYSFGHFYELQELHLYFENEINNAIVTKLLDRSPNIQKLSFKNCLTNFNLDNLYNLTSLTLDLNFKPNENFFKNLCSRLHEISICAYKVDYMDIVKLLFAYNFPYLTRLEIIYTKIAKLEKKLFDVFPILESLRISYNKELITVDNDAFSNLKYLKKLELSYNKISKLDPKSFIGLDNLEELNLKYNGLTHFDLITINYIKKTKHIHILSNPLENREEIMKWFMNRLKEPINQHQYSYPKIS